MSTYNSQLQSNNTDLQTVLQTLQTKAAGGKEPVLQDKTVSPTTSQQTITADSGYDGLDTVTIAAIPSETWILTLEDGSTVEKAVYVG